MTYTEPKRIPCAIASSDYMLIDPRRDGEYMIVTNRSGTSNRLVTIALDRAAAKVLKKELKAFLKGGV